MADVRLISDTSGKYNVHLVLSEGEAKALEAICGYGPDEFIKWFYAHMGKHYLKPYEEGMRSLFNTVRGELPRQISKINKVRKFVKENQ